VFVVPLDAVAIRRRIGGAFELLRQAYATSGGWRYPGYLDKAESYGYIGPFAWSEADYVHRFATFLERDFPGAVHLEMPIRVGTRIDADQPPPGKRSVTTFVDIVVSDLGEMPSDPRAAGERFRGMTHEAFIEVKWFVRAPEKWIGVDWRRFKTGVARDVEKLRVHKQLGRCHVAAMLIVDDSDRFIARVDELTLSEDVDLLLLSPSKVGVSPFKPFP
jgi:hypothetical protein